LYNERSLASVFKKVPVEKTLQKTYSSSESFVGELGWWVIQKGIFLPGITSLPPGIPVRFCFSLSSGKEILAGEGELVLVEDPQGELPQGVFLKFRTLTPRSEENLRRILAWQSAHSSFPKSYEKLNQLLGNFTAS
jgi:hypothetical protein